MDKLRIFWKKNEGILLYLIFGGLTTGVNFLVYIPLYYGLRMSGAVSNLLAWVVAVCFAFVTNKPFVFKSHDWSAAVVFPELGKFVGSRLFSGLLETGLIALTVDVLHFHGGLMKVLTAVMVIILNYVASKWLVFRGK